jgi:murein DD-endopeptidase MepM/ murein hydrolase activator NlpD
MRKKDYVNGLRRALICSSTILLAACSSVNEREVLPEVLRIDRVVPYHIVREGDSVGSVAEQHSMTRTELIKLNNLNPPYQLYAGQKLVINVKAEKLKDQPERDAEFIEREECRPVITNDVSNAEKQAQPPETVEVGTNGEAKPASEYVWPIADGRSKISQHFDESNDDGIIMRASAGTLVRSITDGVVRIAKTLDGDASSYGKTVIILHNLHSKLSVYSHLMEFSVQAGQKVKKGDVIGKVGKSGNAQSAQLCLQIFNINKKDKTRVSLDPEKILP